MKRLSYILMLFYFASVQAKVVFDTLDGRHVDLSGLSNKKIVINYWAEWCHPCIEEIQSLNRFYQDYSKKVALFSVNFDQPSLRAQRDAVKKYHIKYPSLATDPASMLALGDIKALPTTFLLNHDGKLMKVLYGPQTSDTLLMALDFEKVSS